MNTNILYLGLALFVVLIVCSEALPQKPPRPPVKGTRAARVGSEKRYPDYQIELKITGGPKYFVSIISPENGGQIEPGALVSLIADLPTGADASNESSNVFPTVIVEAEPNVTMLDFWNPITLFRRDRTQINISIPTGTPIGGEVFLRVAWYTPDPAPDIKPNPLLLAVMLGADGKLSLNNEPAGSLSDTAPLTNRLLEIFKAREMNGVFREGANEIEKSVTIIMPKSDRKFSDLVTIARAVWLPGADRISLAMDDTFGHIVDDFKGLLDVPLVPRRKKS